MSPTEHQDSFSGIGLMSGSSLDGIDLVFCHFTPKINTDQSPNPHWDWRIEHADTIPYPTEWRQRLQSVFELTAFDYAKLNIDLGHYFGLILRQFIVKNELSPQFVASHGHTAFHQPDKHFTAQIGDGETMSSYLDCPLVSNFRNKDVAMGGEGAPLVPMGEQALFQPASLFLNLGGIANLSIIQRPPDQVFAITSWKRNMQTHLGYDICSCNQVLNSLCQASNPSLLYDPEGALARSGQLNGPLFDQLMTVDFYDLVPPRSLGREWTDAIILPLIQAAQIPLADALHTYIHHIAFVISQEFRKFRIRNTPIMVTGGGAHNVFLMEVLEQQLKMQGIHIIPSPPQLIDYKEALIFAYLGLQTLLGLPNNMPDATGAKKAICCGSIHQPRSNTFRYFPAS
jgi:anhydro-N-acetylmuramic acid kinase